MSIATPTELELSEAVQEWLVKHEASDEFARVSSIAQDCFPGMIAMDAFIQDDPDEENMTSAILLIKLPDSYSLDALQDQRRRYYRMLVEEIGNIVVPQVGILFDFV